MRYRTVAMRTWGDEKFRSLSPPEPSGQFLFLYLLTGPHTGPIPGVFSIGELAIAEARGWCQHLTPPAPPADELPLQPSGKRYGIPYREPYQEPLWIRYRECVGELVSRGMLKADFTAPLWWLPNALKYNYPHNRNVILGWKSAWDDLPECSLKVDICQAFREQFTDKPHLLAAFETITKTGMPYRMGNGIGNGSPYRPLNRLATQEQEQEQDYLSPSPSFSTSLEPARTEDPREGEGAERKKDRITLDRPPQICDHPERATEVRQIIDHYRQAVRSAATRAGADVAILELLLHGASADELRRAADRYGKQCDRENREPRHRLSPKRFFGEGGWEDFRDGTKAPTSPAPNYPPTFHRDRSEIAPPGSIRKPARKTPPTDTPPGISPSSQGERKAPGTGD